MKKHFFKAFTIILISLLVLITSKTFRLKSSAPIRQEAIKQMPHFVLSNLKNSKIDSKKVTNSKVLKGVIVHFWATWCPPCVVEAPNIVVNFFGADTSGGIDAHAA